MPDIVTLRQHMQKLAALTAALSVDLGEPQFSFYPSWTNSQQVAMHIDGCGDELYMHFTSRGCLIKGFAHESEMSPYKTEGRSIWPGVLDNVPPQFANSLKEPAFDPEAATFAIWRLASDSEWSTGDIQFPPGNYQDGSSDLLLPITFTHAEFTAWLAENYERDVDEDIVRSVFEGRPLSMKQMEKLNPLSPLHAIRDAVLETGYAVEERN